MSTIFNKIKLSSFLYNLYLNQKRSERKDHFANNKFNVNYFLILEHFI